MKKYIVILAILPIAAFCKEKELFALPEVGDEVLLHLSYGEEEEFPSFYGLLEKDEESNPQDLSLLEVEESEELLLPWSSEPLSQGEFPTFIEKKAKEMVKECDDAYSYDLPSASRHGIGEPSFEKVPGGKGIVQAPNEKKGPAIREIKPDPVVSNMIKDEGNAFSDYLKKEEQQVIIKRNKRARRSN